MHYAKYGKQAVGSILLHSDRGIDSPDTHKHSNENIDRTRTHLNYDLRDRGGLTAYAYYKQRIEQIARETKERTGKSIRKDAVTLCSWAVTVPKDLAEDKQAKFFETAYRWFAGRYGEDNIVTAAVHMDENTPHMHLQFTPIIEKDGVRRLCAKDMETKRTLATAHQKLQKYLEKSLGCEVNLLNGATEGGNKTIQQLKAEELQAKNERVKLENERLNSENIDLQQEIDLALAYEPPGRKFLESDKKYVERVSSSYQAWAVGIRSKKLDKLDMELNKRDESLNIREQLIGEREENIEQILDNAYQKGSSEGIEIGRKKQKGEDEEQFIKAIAILKNQHKQEIAELQGQIKQRDEIIRLQNKDAELLKRGLKKRGIDTENIIKAEKNKKALRK